jgi:phage terminase large subunit-like protein
MIIHTNGFLEEYHHQIMSGQIIAGYELKDELTKLINDMKDDRYVYDTRDADMRMDFMENCVRLTKSPFYGQPMKLMLWQKAFISAMYGFKMAEDQTDRFRRILLLIARKNTKSETCSGLGLTELITGNDGSDIVCSSNDDNQANILYTAIDTMRLMIDPKQKDTWKNQQWIKCKINGSKVFKLSDRTRNKEGRNIDFAIIDEVHEMKDNVIIKSIEQSQSLKPNPKLILITTEGFVNDGFLDEELVKARKILNGEDDSISAERYLPWLYTQDSEQEVWQDERSWQKSNPTLGIVKRWDYLREQVDAARRSKADRMFTLSKDFNFKVSNSEAWLMREMLDYSRVYDLNEFKGTICLAGVDLAETTDMCSAKILLLKKDDPTKYIHQMYWIPESKLKMSDDKESGAKYTEWAKEGLIRIVEGNEVDVSLIADWFAELYKDYDIRLFKAGYDQRFAKQFLKRMDDYGFEYEMIYQNRYVLTSPMRLVEADIRDQLINRNDNPIDIWCLSNTSIQMWDTGHIMPIKIKNQANRRIDGTLSEIMCYEMLRRYKTEMMNALR